MMEKDDDFEEHEDMHEVRKLVDSVTVESQLQNLIQLVWYSLPQQSKTADTLEERLLHLVNRAMENLREDERFLGGKS